MHVVANKNLITEIRHSYGICQGDPISPYLFIMVMEMFTRMIKDKVNRKEQELVSIKGVGKFSHLLFVDDVILMAKTTEKSIKESMILLKN